MIEKLGRHNFPRSYVTVYIDVSLTLEYMFWVAYHFKFKCTNPSM